MQYLTGIFRWTIRIHRTLRLDSLIFLNDHLTLVCLYNPQYLPIEIKTAVNILLPVNFNFPAHIIPGLLVSSSWLFSIYPGPILLTVAVALTGAGMDVTLDLCYVRQE